MIEVKGLVKTYGAKRAVDGISFSVRKGDILGFLGPNGAGKSTTMKMITGFLRPDSGTATVGGIDVTQNPVAAREQVGDVHFAAGQAKDIGQPEPHRLGCLGSRIACAGVALPAQRQGLGQVR